MTNLELLASKVHTWPTHAVAALWQEDKPVWLVYPTPDIELNPLVVYYQDWLTERERLQNKPKWEHAPEWARWLAQDSMQEGGSWTWYEFEPKPDDVEWVEVFPNDGGIKVFGSGLVIGDWKETLEQRPKPKLNEAAQMQHKFKVGDKVKAVKWGRGCSPDEIGTVSTITGLGLYKDGPGYQVDNLKNKTYNGFICERSFELVQNEPERPTKKGAVTESDRQHPAAAQAAHPESITPVIDFDEEEQIPEIQSKFKKAPDILTAGIKHMEDRATLRDSSQGERSMKAAVAAFNALEGTNLTEVQGWRFMCVLKHARAAKGALSIDDYEDAAAYWALAAEAAQQ